MLVVLLSLQNIGKQIHLQRKADIRRQIKGVT